MRYVIVGTGPAGVTAAETVRRKDPNGEIALVGDELPPYARMLLPYLLAGQIDEKGTRLRRDPEHYDRLAIRRIEGRVERITPPAGQLQLAGGESLSYDRLLIATGSTPVHTAIRGTEHPGVCSCWTLEDARRIRERVAARPGCRVVLVGVGFIGCIVMDALLKLGLQLTVVEAADRVLPRMLNPTGAGLFQRWFESHGVEVLTCSAVAAIQPAGEELQVVLEGGQERTAGLVVLAAGVRPNTGLLEGSGVRIEQGVLVDHHLRSNIPSIFAAGDVAQGPELAAATRAVHALHPTAVEHGRVAGLNMAGGDARYAGSLSMNELHAAGLSAYAYGRWTGASDGDASEALDASGFRYTRLEFEGDRLASAIVVGQRGHVGALRGLIQTPRVHLGPWKDRLRAAPHRLAEAYVACTR